MIPIVEVNALLIIENIIGLTWLIVSVLLTSIAGCFLFRYLGSVALWDIWDTMDRGKVPLKGIIDRFIMIVGACLIILPGFLTGALGVALLLPPFHIPLRAMLMRFIEKNLKENLSAKAYQDRHDHSSIIEGEYKRMD